jgi:hypothetical protein
MTYKIWANDGYDGWEIIVEAESFEAAIQKAGGVMTNWVSITDDTETRRFPDEKN